MIPRIASGGKSFAGSWAYYGHDKGQSTRNRVEWTHTENMITTDPDKAVKVMAYTALEQARLKEASGQVHTGRKLEKPVFSYSLAWHPEQNPTKEHMLETTIKSVKALGLEEHETLVVAHRDEPQKHVHVIINRVHPVTGIAGSVSNSKRKLSSFARLYERENGKIYCRQREENHQKRQQGEKAVYRDKHIAEAWTSSDCGTSFRAALLERGYQLAEGRKRVVVVDPHGQIHNPTRHIERVKAKDVNARLKQIDPASLRDATQVSQEIQASNRNQYAQEQEHDRRSAQLINEMQDRHFEEKSQLSRKHQSRIDAESTRLAEHYDLAGQEAEIEKLRTKASRKGVLGKVLNRLSGVRKRLAEAQRGYENAKWRFEERLQGFRKDRDRELERLATRHLREKQGLEKLLSQRRPQEIQRSRHVRERVRTRDRQQGREDLRRRPREQGLSM